MREILCNFFTIIFSQPIDNCYLMWYNSSVRWRAKANPLTIKKKVGTQPMKLYEIICHRENSHFPEQTFAITRLYTDKEQAMSDCLCHCATEELEIAEIENDMRDSACNAEELNVTVKQYHYYAEDERYRNVCESVCTALTDDNILAYFACYKNEYREDNANVRLILKEVEV